MNFKTDVATETNAQVSRVQVHSHVPAPAEFQDKHRGIIESIDYLDKIIDTLSELQERIDSKIPISEMSATAETRPDIGTDISLKEFLETADKVILKRSQRIQEIVAAITLMLFSGEE